MDYSPVRIEEKQTDLPYDRFKKVNDGVDHML